MWVKKTMQPFKDLFHLVYPNLCLACGYELKTVEDVICFPCKYKLPKTKFHLEKDNPVIEHFWGRVPVKAAASYFYFSKGGFVQHLIHQLKYKGKHRIGAEFGKQYGRQLKNSGNFEGIDLIVPVPIHIRKKRLRGYNQSAMFAKGLAIAFGVPWTEALKRLDIVDSQTSKSRLERFQNVENSFKVTQPNLLEGKHILLVDDVITTGATLEACSTKILAIPNVKISMAVLAFAQ